MNQIVNSLGQRIQSETSNLIPFFFSLIRGGMLNKLLAESSCLSLLEII